MIGPGFRYHCHDSSPLIPEDRSQSSHQGHSPSPREDESLRQADKNPPAASTFSAEWASVDPFVGKLVV